MKLSPEVLCSFTGLLTPVLNLIKTCNILLILHKAWTHGNSPKPNCTIFSMHMKHFIAKWVKRHFFIFKVRAPSCILQTVSFRMIFSSLYMYNYRGIFLKLWSKVPVHQFSDYFLYISVVSIANVSNRQKSDITRFAMKLFIIMPGPSIRHCEGNCAQGCTHNLYRRKTREVEMVIL